MGNAASEGIRDAVRRSTVDQLAACAAHISDVNREQLLRAMQSSHVVFMSMSMTGHLNPTLPCVKELISRGCTVTYYTDKAVQLAVEAAGATFRPFPNPDDPTKTGPLLMLDDASKEKWKPDPDAFKTMKIMTQFIYSCVKQCPLLIEELRAMKPPPSVIVGDPAFPHHNIVGHAMELPVVGFFTMPGPGCLAEAYRGLMSGTFAEAAEVEGRPWIAEPTQTIKDMYGYDVFKKGSFMEFFSEKGNVCTTISDLFAPAGNEVQKARFGDFPWDCVGPVVDTSMKRVNNLQEKDSMLEQVDAAVAQGKMVLYISLGTVATGALWNGQLGTGSQGNEQSAEGKKPLTEMTGKELSHYVWGRSFEAFGGRDDMLVVMTTSQEADAMEGLPPVPGNFIVRDRVPQLDVLQKAGAFLSHGGANSIHEALTFGVPLAILPIFGDQIINADTVAKTGAGISFRHPMKTVNVDTLREKALLLLGPDASTNTYRAKAQLLAQQLKSAGGASRAADCILRAAGS